MNKIRTHLRGIVKDLWIVLLDIIAVNAAYLLALLLRFYVNNQFRPTVSYYLSDFARFAPFYTVLCIAVFAAFRLYNGMWRYAGLNDMNRILMASAVTCVIQVAGTMIFIRRMPITYYVLGAVIQFLMIAAIRFAYRFVTIEQKKIASRKLPAIHVMVVGAGEIGRRVIKQLEDDSAYRAVCVIDSKSTSDGKTMDGIPVLCGAAQLEGAVKQYGVKAVFIADPALSAEDRQSIRSFCSEQGLELQDYTGYLSNLTGRVSLTGLLEAVDGPVTVERGSGRQEYADGSAALQDLTDRFNVRRVSAEEGRLVLTLEEPRSSEPFAGYEAWQRKHQEETGEEISYF